jgi:hypothetical protein
MLLAGCGGEGRTTSASNGGVLGNADAAGDRGVNGEGTTAAEAASDTTSSIGMDSARNAARAAREGSRGDSAGPPARDTAAGAADTTPR